MIKLKMIFERFIEEAKQIHGNSYIYNKSNYIDYYTDFPIECRIHGTFGMLKE